MRKRVIALLLLLAACIQAVQSQLVINELMQSNVDCIMDDLNDFPDSWVELYNAGDDAVNLGEYRIGKTPGAMSAWRLPAQTVAPKGHIVICCDKVGKGLHTDFRLESGNGCQVFLLHDVEAVDWVSGLPKQPAPNTAYGRRSDGSDEWGYMTTPTPGMPNAGGLAKGTLGKPLFNREGGVQTNGEAFQLRLSIPENSPKGTIIRYTTDGSEPTAISKLHTRPITIDKSTVVRARLFCNGWLSPPSTCHSYIFFPDNRPLTLPVVSIVTDDRYLNDSLIGIYTEGSYQADKPNYKFNWRRPINIELFETADVPASLNQLCETRIFGGTSRTENPKSLVINAHKRFGINRLAYEFFPDQRPGITDYKSIALRNAGQDCKFLYMRDAIIQRTMAENTDIDWQSWRPTIVFINGQYRGIQNIRDRSNEDNIYTYYDGTEDIDMIDIIWLKAGTEEKYKAFKAFYSESGHTMAEYKQWMDCYEYINLMTMNIYHNNIDFPGTNNVMWRPRTTDGRWRWIAKDTDWGMGLYGLQPEYDYVSWINDHDYDSQLNWSNSPEHTLLFRNLMANSDFQREFIDHMAVYMGDFLNERGISAVWSAMYEKVKIELPHHRHLYNLEWKEYEEEMERTRNWLAKRTKNVYQHLADFYSLGTPIPLTISKGADILDITINNIPLRSSSFDGMFFAGRNLTVKGKTKDGLKITGWRLTSINNGTARTITMRSPACAFNLSTCDSLAITPITAVDDGIKSLSASPQSTAVYNLQGVRLAKMQKGLNIVGGRKIAVR